MEGSVRQSMLTLVGERMNVGWWLFVLAITAGTNALDFMAAAQPDAARSATFAVAALIRILLVFWIGFAILRRLAGPDGLSRAGMPFLRFSLFMIVMVALLAAATGLAVKLTGAGADNPVTGVVAFLLMTLISLALIRLYAWQAALAIGDRKLGPKGAWKALASRTGELRMAYLLLIVPVAALHSLLTRIALASGDDTATLLGLALVDGAVSAVQLVLTCSLAVSAWRAARYSR
jgi:hypothetical protein